MLSNSFPKCAPLTLPPALRDNSSAPQPARVVSLTVAILVVVWIFISLMTVEIRNAFSYVHWAFGCLLVFCVSRFPPFFCWLVCLCLLISMSVLYNLNIGSLSDVSICVLQISLCVFLHCIYNLCLLQGHKDILWFF